MSRDKQIEEMAKAVCHLDRTCDECMTSFECKAMMYAKRFYNAGYRKASEVAEEIFAEIGELINEYLDGRSYRHEFLTKIAELKKKYTQGEEKIPPYVRMDAKALPAILNVKYTEEEE
jgi:DNA-directed RNA polymerase subunit F